MPGRRETVTTATGRPSDLAHHPVRRSVDVGSVAAAYGRRTMTASLVIHRPPSDVAQTSGGRGAPIDAFRAVQDGLERPVRAVRIEEATFAEYDQGLKARGRRESVLPLGLYQAPEWRISLRSQIRARSSARCSCARRRDNFSRGLDRSPRIDRGRGGVQHRNERLPGDPHRSLVLPPDRHPDLPAHRQHRRQPRGCRGRSRPCGRVGDSRSAATRQQLAHDTGSRDLPGRRRHRRHRRDRYAQAHAHPARGWCARWCDRRRRRG